MHRSRNTCASTQKLHGLTFPPFTSTPKLLVLTFAPFNRSCDKYGTLVDLAVGRSVTVIGIIGCAGKSADALLIKHCSAPLSTHWKRGISVKDHFSVIKHYTPIGEWKGQTFTDVSGVFVSCDNGVIEMISQSCGGSLSLKNITSPSSDALYTIRWSYFIQ